MINIKKLAIFALFMVAGVVITTCYFKCNPGHNTGTQDTLKPVIDHQNILIGKLRAENDSLRALHSVDSIAKIALNQNIIQLGQQHTVYITQVKLLPFDSACGFAQGNFVDTTKIIKMEFGGKTRACITPVQLSEVNSTYANNTYLLQLNDSMDRMVGIMLNADNLNAQIISNYEKMLLAKDTINQTLQAKIESLQGDLTATTKKYKRQRFWKFVYKGAALVELLIIAVK
jgi:hypothetical protein